jgi:hypothetical protein
MGREAWDFMPHALRPTPLSSVDYLLVALRLPSLQLRFTSALGLLRPLGSGLARLIAARPRWG